MLVSGSVVVLSFKGCIKNTKDLTHCRHFGCTGILSPPQKKHRNHWQKDTWLLGVQVSKRLMRKNDNFLWLQPSFKGYRHASFRQVVDIRESITNRWPLSQQMEEKKDMRTSYTKILSHGHSNVKYLVCIWILQPLRTHFFEVPKRITSPTHSVYIYIFLTSNAVGTCCFSQHVFSFCPPKNHWPKRPFAVLFSSRDHVDQGRFLPTKDHDLRQRPWERSLPHFHHGNPWGTRC